MNDSSLFDISFKNVGQGDCIILEWQSDNGVKEIGIIDCNAKMPNSKVILESIKRHIGQYNKVAFLLLSHPHNDHFSGIGEILDYCKIKEIEIEYIFDTSILTSESLNLDLIKKPSKQKLLSSYLNSKYDISELFLVLEKFILWEQEKGTKRRFLQGGQTLVNQGSIKIDCLSPTREETKKYLIETFATEKPNEFKKRRNNPNANLLSTIIHIHGNHWQLLLTSDAPQYAFQRILNEKYNKPHKNKPLFIIQIPHHGSIENHLPIFWDEYMDKSITSSIISSGKHESYEHPHFEVVTFFHNKSKSVYATNNVHGYKDFYKKSDSEPFLKEDFALIDLELNQLDFWGNKCGEQKVRIYENDGNVEYKVETI
jgi:beta-lactamase superfamily II metal-dependent hydrolase